MTSEYATNHCGRIVSLEKGEKTHARVARHRRKAIEKHRLLQWEAKLRADDLWKEHDYVFCTLTGTHPNPNHVVEELKKVLRQAGLPEIRFHDLRHSAATLLLSLGVHPKVVQELLGHTQSV